MRTTNEEALRRLAEIIRDHGVMSSLEYDRLVVEDKPSRWKLRQGLEGGWDAAVAAALKILESDGIKPNGLDLEDEVGQDERVAKLLRQIDELRRHHESTKLTLKGTTFRFGVLGDTQIGSLYTDYALLEFAYKTFRDEGVTEVLHAGDIMDGIKMYKGHEYELEAHGEDSQLKLVEERYPYKEGITTRFIDGNHDRSFWKLCGSVTGEKIAARRPDLHYLGYMEADIVLGEGRQAATVRLAHPEDGTAYAISYKTQKYLNELPSGTKPDILLIGHYHKSEFLYYRGVLSYQVGCIQAQTPWMRGRKIGAAQGFWILEITVGRDRVVRVNQTFYPVRS